MNRGERERVGGEGLCLGLRLPADLERRLLEWVRAAGPREACGLLLGRLEDSLAAAVEVVELSNLASRADRFRLDPAGHLCAERRAEELGLVVLGVWHGHPSGDPEPSFLDLRGTPPGWCQLILGRGAAGGNRLAAWQRTGSGFRPLQLIRPAGGRSRPEGLRPGASSIR